MPRASIHSTTCPYKPNSKLRCASLCDLCNHVTTSATRVTAPILPGLSQPRCPPPPTPTPQCIGADGLPTPNYAAYGATKAGITHLTATLQRELAGTRVRLHTVSPGMILTDLLLEGATTANKQVGRSGCGV